MLKELEKRLKENSNPGRAKEMTRYLKGQFSFFGIMANERVALFKELEKNFGKPDPNSRKELLEACFQAPQREFHYFGIFLYERSQKSLDPTHMPEVEFMIANRSWWDTVDYAINKVLGPLIQRNPEIIGSHMAHWNQDPNMWKVRASLLFQLKWKKKTRTEVLSRFILNHQQAREFFIRKAMGWALREYSKTDPAWVRTFVKDHSLPGLTAREALKWLNNQAKKT